MTTAESRPYDLARWARVRQAVLARDGHRCTIGRLIGGACSGTLHVHHLVPVSEGGDLFDEDNCTTACATHHPWVESARRAIVGKREWRRCRRHRHPYPQGRAECERRLNHR